jgi:hypothetical protein
MDPIPLEPGPRGDEPGREPKRFVAQLRARGLSLNAAANLVARLYGLSRPAARLFVASHPAWAGEAPD